MAEIVGRTLPDAALGWSGGRLTSGSGGQAEGDHVPHGQLTEASAIASAERDEALAASELATLAARASALETIAARVPALEAELRRSRQAETELATRLQAILTSASWRATLPLRAMFGRSPALRRAMRRTAQAVWWAATFQLPRRLAARRAAQPSPASGIAPPRTVLADQAAGSLRAFLASGERLRFTPGDMPDVSVLIVVWNKAHFTLRCLRALLAVRERLEVIVVDNASTDETGELLGRVDGIRVIRNATNEGFLLATNRAAGVATGRDLLLLNNDAFVRPGAIAAALATLRGPADIGAVGGRLVRPDERLQEAGSIIYADGSSIGYARDADPEAGEAMFRRDVDYCSGAFLLTPRAVWERQGGFDTAYAPAYYEEADYCMRLRASGLRTVYEPDAVVDHFEFGSEAQRGEAVALMLRNRKRFRDRHAARLLCEHLPPAGGNLLAARSAATGRARRLLVIDDVVPLGALGSGWPRAREILVAAAAAGWSVTLYPTAQDAVDWPVTRREIPAEVEIIVNGGGPGLGTFLAARAGFFDTILVSRPHNMISLRTAAEHADLATAGVRILYDAEALFSLREAEQARVRGTPMPQSEIDKLIDRELGLCAGADGVLCVTAAEARVFRDHLRDAATVPIHVLSHPTTPRVDAPGFNARHGFLFVGRLKEKESPNWDGLAWFVAECWPAIRDALPDATLTVAGHVHADARPISGRGIRVLGPVDDLGPLYDAARVFIAPIRFAAGIPIKILEATAAGLPTAGTRLMARQMNFTPDAEMVAEDEPALLARAAAGLHADPAAWRAMRDAAMRLVAREHGAEAFRQSLLRALGEAAPSPAGHPAHSPG